MRAATLLIAAAASLAATSAAATPASAAPVAAAGSFAVKSVQVVKLTPVGSGACLITADVALQLNGTLRGTAAGPIRIASKSPCDQQPKAGDTFVAPLTFTGTVRTAKVTTTIVYAGITRPDGSVTGTMAVTKPQGVLQVAAKAGVGGTYRGVLG